MDKYFNSKDTMDEELNNSVLTDLKLYKEDGEYFLRATCHCHNSSNFEYDMLIEKIRLPVKENLNFNYVSDNEALLGERHNLKLINSMAVDLGFGRLDVEENNSCELFSTMNYSGGEEVVAKQLEKLLGHKVMVFDCK